MDISRGSQLSGLPARPCTRVWKRRNAYVQLGLPLPASRRSWISVGRVRRRLSSLPDYATASLGIGTVLSDGQARGGTSIRLSSRPAPTSMQRSAYRSPGWRPAFGGDN